MHPGIEGKGIKRKFSIEGETQGAFAKAAKTCNKASISTSPLKCISRSPKNFSANERLKIYRKNLEQKKNIVCKVHTVLGSTSSTQNENVDRTIKNNDLEPHQPTPAAARIANIRQSTKQNNHLKYNVMTEKFRKYTIPKTTHKPINVVTSLVASSDIETHCMKQPNIPNVFGQSSNLKPIEISNNNIDDLEMDWSAIDETEVVSDVSSI